MKRISAAPYLGLLLAFLLPLLLNALLPEGTDRAPQPSQTLPPSPAPSAAASPDAAAGPATPETIRVKTDDGVLEMDMQEYLIGVVAAEMPASFQPEALKAQAVAARSYAMYCISHGRHADAQVCTDYACCQSWMSDGELSALWGGSFDEYRARIAAAVEQTDRQYLEYDGEPAFAAFHSSSASATEDCENVWSALPYLVSVDSPETALDVPDYVSTVRCSPLDFRDTVLYAFPDADFTGGRETWIGRIDRDKSGRVSCAVLGGAEIPGTTLRSLFRLRSTAFELTYSGGEFVFTVTGYGHGVGMSQYGANVMAQNGADYAGILAHYYQGTTLVTSRS